MNNKMETVKKYREAYQHSISVNNWRIAESQGYNKYDLKNITITVGVFAFGMYLIVLGLFLN